MPLDYGTIIISTNGKQEVLKSYSDAPVNEWLTTFVLESQKGVRFQERKQFSPYLQQDMLQGLESLIGVPMKYHGDVVGMITIGSQDRYAYGPHHMMLLEMLGSFLAIALSNARDYEQKKRESERCPLTHLYNYRYFIEALERQFITHQQTNRPFSIVLLDLDYFKSVNDTYGHEAGNELLCQVAKRLKEEVAADGEIARYGGEEFIILLPNCDISEACDRAEVIRERLAQDTFMLSSMNDEKGAMVHVTASIGVATAPQHGEDPLSLIRNADRAMYTGAKQKGRNRVSVAE